VARMGNIDQFDLGLPFFSHRAHIIMGHEWGDKPVENTADYHNVPLWCREDGWRDLGVSIS
jgi:hypothetical protein